MAQTYTRQSTFTDGDTITAALFNDEYNQLVNAFTYSSTSASSTGHRHDGTAGQGGNIPKIGDLDFLNKIEVDSTNNRLGFYVEVSSAAVEQIRIQDGAIVPVTDNDIDLGTSSLEFKDLFIDGTATIDTLTVNEAATVGTTLGVTGATTLSSTLGVSGATTLSSTLAVTGTSTLTGNVTTTNDLSVGGNLTVTGTSTFNGGTITMGDAASDNVVFGADVNSNIIPNTDNTYDLGSSSQEWKDIYIDGTAYLDDINFNGTAITATAAELNIMDGVTATTTEINLLDGVTSTTAELNILDGVTATATEINLLDGVTSTTAELNILDGVTATATELNLLDGVTSTTAELNVLDGITAVVGELNALDLGSTAIGTAIASKAVVLDANKDYTGIRNLTIAGDLTISGDDLFMATNTAGHLLIADGTNFNPTAVGDLSEISTIANDDVLLAVDTSGGGLKRVTRSTLVSGIAAGTEISNVVEDTTPQLGGDLDVNGNALVSTSNGNIALTPNGTGVVRIDGNVDIQTGEIVLKNGGSVSNIKLYCEASNAHYTQLQSAAHSAYSGNVTVTLPAATDTLVGKATTDTLTNKTLTSPKINEDVAVTATATELNILDGVTSTTAELNILDGVTATATELNILDGVTSTAAELNILDGVTSTTAELNILDGVTSTTAELNILDGVTATATELNLLDGVTSTTAELNILDGVTSTTAELNLVDGSSAGTVVNSKAVVYGSSGEVNATTLQVGGTAITSTPAELNILDGVTATTAEINKLDGVTSTTAELNILDGVTSTASELNILDGATVTTTELNKLDGLTASTTELNKLDGVTATTAELNYTDGVTSNIQTQLDAIPAGTSTSAIAASGDVYVGVNAESYVRFQGSSGVKYARFYLEGDEDVRFTEGGTGYFNGNVVAYSTDIASDGRFKDNVKPLEGCLDKVCQMRGVSYTWNEKSQKEGVEDIGVIAQEMAKIYPEIVTEVDGLNGRDSHLTVDYGRLTCVLINAVKELKKEIEELKSVAYE